MTTNWEQLEALAMSEEEVRQHLLSRGFDTDKNLWDYDSVSGTVYLRLYSPDRRLIGMQEYRPMCSQKGGRDKKFDATSPKKYFSAVPLMQNKLTRFWGMQNLDERPYAFVTEGVFDAAPIAMMGYPAIALIGSDLPDELEQQLKLLRKRFIAILDNDEAGYIKGGKHKIHNVIRRLGGENFVTPDPYKDFGEMFMKDREDAEKFISDIARFL